MQRASVRIAQSCNAGQGIQEGGLHDLWYALYPGKGGRGGAVIGGGTAPCGTAAVPSYAVHISAEYLGLHVEV